jgi:hypothetical protein
MSTWYLASWGDDITQRAHCGVQGPNHGRNPHIDALPFCLLRGVVEGEKCRLRVPTVSPSDSGSSSCVQVTSRANQSLGWAYADPRRRRPSCDTASFGTAPPVAAGVVGTVMETCPVVTTMEDTSAASSSVRPIADALDVISTYAGGNSGHAISICNVVIAPDCAAHVCGAATTPDCTTSTCDVTTTPRRAMSITGTSRTMTEPTKL